MLRQNGEISRRFATLSESKPADEYNFDHFRTKILVEDVWRTIEPSGICPGELAPDFDLPQVGGGSLRLEECRGRPVILHFGSYS